MWFIDGLRGKVGSLFKLEDVPGGSFARAMVEVGHVVTYNLCNRQSAVNTSMNHGDPVCPPVLWDGGVLPWQIMVYNIFMNFMILPVSLGHCHDEHHSYRAIMLINMMRIITIQVANECCTAMVYDSNSDNAYEDRSNNRNKCGQ